MTNTVPPTMIPAVAPSVITCRFSSTVDGRRAMAENPTARIAIGIAVSMPWPSLSAMNAAAAENNAVINTPSVTERALTSARTRSAGTSGSYVSPGASGR